MPLLFKFLSLLEMCCFPEDSAHWYFHLNPLKEKKNPHAIMYHKKTFISRSSHTSAFEYVGFFFFSKTNTCLSL